MRTRRLQLRVHQRHRDLLEAAVFQEEVTQFPALHMTAVDRPQHRPMAATRHHR